MPKRINAFFNRLCLAFDAIAVLMLVIIVVSILLQVLFRWLALNIQWTEELARYSFVYLVFFGGTSAVRRTVHIAITTLVDVMPDWLRRGVDVLNHLMVAVMTVILAYGAMVLSRSATGVTSSVMQWFQMNYLYIPIGISCLLMAVMALVRCLDVILDKDLIRRERDAQAKLYGGGGK